MTPPLPPELGALDDRFVIRTREVDIGGRMWRLELPHSAEDLISEDDFGRDERLPYWADLWPSAIVLAREVSALREEKTDRLGLADLLTEMAMRLRKEFDLPEK